VATEGERERRRRQIERLLGYRKIGPLAAGAIATNVGASPKEIQPILDRLVEEGRATKTGDGRYGAPAGARGG
jgi:predicted ArsR family transcriptional regulator